MEAALVPVLAPNFVILFSTRADRALRDVRDVAVPGNVLVPDATSPPLSLGDPCLGEVFPGAVDVGVVIVCHDLVIPHTHLLVFTPSTI
jgi:hypothetical protein